jgi:glycosyltransferase involved in cell wall biosynthesis
VTARTRSLAVLIPGDLDTRTGGYEYDRRIVAGLRDAGWTVDVVGLRGEYPHPDAAARAAARSALAAFDAGALVMVDGLALGTLPGEVLREQHRLRLVALVHHPLALETGLDAETAAELESSERRALEAVRLIVVTSSATAATLGRYGVDSERVAVVEPGTDPAPLARGSETTPHLIAVGSLVPRKGYETLIAAMARLSDRPWHLTCVGSLDRDPETAAIIRRAIADHGLEKRVTLIGELGERDLAAEYHRADLFVLATHYEGFGMAVAEALARGLPVVSTPTGGIPRLVGQEAGILVPPGDVGALAKALARVLDAPVLRADLCAAARRVRDSLPTWEDAARAMSAALERVAHG